VGLLSVCRCCRGRGGISCPAGNKTLIPLSSIPWHTRHTDRANPAHTTYKLHKGWIKWWTYCRTCSRLLIQWYRQMQIVVAKSGLREDVRAPSSDHFLKRPHSSVSYIYTSATAQAVSRRLPTAASRVQIRVWSCEIL
jgi:hypothetical protein